LRGCVARKIKIEQQQGGEEEEKRDKIKRGKQHKKMMGGKNEIFREGL